MRIHVLGASFVALATLVGCSSGNGSQFGDGGTGSSSGGSSSGGSSSGGTGSSSGGSGGSSSGIIITAGDGGTSSGGTGDGGFVCDPNPANYDIPGNDCDDDNDGTKDNPPVACDNGTLPSGLSAVGTAADMMAAMGLCQAADATHWGVVSATYTNGYAQTTAGGNKFAYQHKVMNSFGSTIKPREGSALGNISSGTADLYDTQDVSSTDTAATAAFKGLKSGMQKTSGSVPSGFPKASTGCDIDNTVNDVIDVKVQIKIPANAKGFSFDFDFWSGEWPDYVCTSYNDSFIAYLKSTGFKSGTPDNISFDSNGNPISVNVGFFNACTAGIQTGCSAAGGGIFGGGAATGPVSTCASGTGDLTGTGFLDTGPWCPSGSDPSGSNVSSAGGGATGWLTSTAPVTPGETISLDFLIWDTGDKQYDSSVLLDNWVWSPQEVASTPVTQPSPPK